MSHCEKEPPPECTVRQGLSQRILALKSRLPGNGDFLWVTEDPPADDEADQEDLAKKFSKAEYVGEQIRKAEPEIQRIAYEHAREYAQRVGQQAATVRNKALTLMTMASFSSAVLLGLSPLLLEMCHGAEWWLKVSALLIGTAVVSHLLHSVNLSVGAAMREVAVEESPLDVVEISHEVDLETTYRKAAARQIAYASQTAEYVRQRTNQVILAQAALQWGIRYFALLLAAWFIVGVWPHASNGGTGEPDMKTTSTTTDPAPRLPGDRSSCPPVENETVLDEQVRSRSEGYTELDATCMSNVQEYDSAEPGPTPRPDAVNRDELESGGPFVSDVLQQNTVAR
jgi:hypothetical protein